LPAPNWVGQLKPQPLGLSGFEAGIEGLDQPAGKRACEEVGFAVPYYAVAGPFFGQVFCEIVDMVAVLVQHADPTTAKTGGERAQLHLQATLGGCRRHRVGPCMVGGVQKAAAPERSRLLAQCIDRHRLDPANEADDQRDDKEGQKQEEQNLGDAGRGAGDAAKSENAGNERDHEEDESVIKHGNSPLNCLAEQRAGAWRGSGRK
jgi:hypothetical protein